MSIHDLEIRCLVDSIDAFRITPADDAERLDQRLLDILKETANVLELLLEPTSAGSLLDIAEQLDFKPFAVQKELQDFQEGVDELLYHNLDCDTLPQAKALQFVKVPEELDLSDVEDVVKTLAELGNLETYDACEALKKAAREDR